LPAIPRRAGTLGKRSRNRALDCPHRRPLESRTGSGSVPRLARTACKRNECVSVCARQRPNHLWHEARRGTFLASSAAHHLPLPPRVFSVVLCRSTFRVRAFQQNLATNRQTQKVFFLSEKAECCARLLGTSRRRARGEEGGGAGWRANASRG